MLTPDALPPVHYASNLISIRSQREFTRSMAVMLLLLVTAAASAAVALATDRRNLSAAVTVCSLGGALLLELQIRRRKSAERWYAGRAAAESTKTLAWRYAVGGEPFPSNGPTLESRERLLTRLRETIARARHIGLEITVEAEQITRAMESLRSAPLASRRAAYLSGRIEDQRDWYESKAAFNVAQASRLQGLIVLLTVGTVAGAILHAAGTLNLAISALGATVIASVAAWRNARQHESLAAAYRLAALELSAIEASLPAASTESAWATFVSDAEDAISREHTMWTASRRLP
jgi:hypothetical protein